MKYLIFSDLHANINSLLKLKSLIKTIEYDKILYLGDLCDHKHNDESFIKEFSQLKNVVAVRGNCDSDAIIYNQSVIDNQFMNRYISGIPRGPIIVDKTITICHGSIPYENHYIHDVEDTIQSFNFLDKNKCNVLFYGHIHIPIGFVKKTNGIISEIDITNGLILEKGSTYLICPGSLGKPKQNSLKKTFIIYDSETSEISLNHI